MATRISIFFKKPIFVSSVRNYYRSGGKFVGKQGGFRPVNNGLKPFHFIPAGLVACSIGLGYFIQWRLDVTEKWRRAQFGDLCDAAGFPESQPSVYSQTKNHALFLWIHLKPTANSKECARVAGNLQKIVDKVCPPGDKTDENEVIAGVGFGPNFLSQVSGRAKKNFNYPHRKGALGDMPSSGGDIFIHAKCDEKSMLFELCQEVIAQLPANSVDQFEDIYSFVYKNGRDLSGFIDGTENAADEDDRRNIAVEKETGGSYVITQKWFHKLNVIRTERDSNMEKWVGRTRPDSIELSRKPLSSHVARMTGGNAFQQKKPVEIVRQSMPFGSVSKGAGLFFIGYAASPENFEFMLDNMVGACPDGHSDDIMRLTECVKGTYWYFPGKGELQKLV